MMSGTSADGIDVAIVDFRRKGLSVTTFGTFPYPPAIRELILAMPRSGTTANVCRLNFIIGELFAEAIIKLCRHSRISPASIDLIGSHGQTIYHDPVAIRLGKHLVRSTLQIGEPSVIAARTGITTIADFRPADIAAGGQGAPLVPFADYCLFSHPRKTRVIQNIGGIADISDIIAFDTGPGNMTIDRTVFNVTRGRLHFDKDGRLAAKGRGDTSLLMRLMKYPYLRLRPPKTTGREIFGENFTDMLCRRSRLAPADLLATVTAFTACSIADACRRFLPAQPDEVILCGGGARNPTLVEMLRKELAPAAVLFTDDLGINADAKEAISFAILARETFLGKPSNVPSATGASRPAILGKIIPGKLS
jgi:anhydro-N-acetylmuramic acid kinase